MNPKSLISAEQLTKDNILNLFAAAEKYKQIPNSDILKDKIIAMCFFEPSTRTRLSFEAAILRMGGKVIGFSDAAVSSAKKGETLEDSIKVISSYADAIVIRHPEQNAAERAAKVATVPVINAGDGANQHPTQSLIDLFTMQEAFTDLDGLQVGICGDLKYGRAVHSLIDAGAKFNFNFYFIADNELALPADKLQQLNDVGVKFTVVDDFEKVINKLDVLYVTRVQKERFAADSSIIKSVVVDKNLIAKGRKDLKVMHPLPRVDELAGDVDDMAQALYFQQAANGVCVRSAILSGLFVGVGS